MELSSGQALDLNFSRELLDSAQELMDSSQELLESSQELVETFPDEERDETHDETHDEAHDEAHGEAYDEAHDETFDEVHEVHKGQDLVGINGPLPDKCLISHIEGRKRQQALTKFFLLHTVKR
ncbi:5802_t:CDS:2 [Dentiscutata heterogama]|uniref:5802_t:CDS:1 n=1 Tax=Dentiscutata heterogama TaxID=1316150 RepID=A0ACA9JXX5_9GLOM|nr:5802_t:CDS:2 [Dentiscutata heterogama]